MGLAASWLSFTNYLYWARISCLPGNYPQKPHQGSASILSIFRSLQLTPYTKGSQTHLDWMGSQLVSGSSSCSKAGQHQIPSRVLGGLSNWVLKASMEAPEQHVPVQLSASWFRPPDTKPLQPPGKVWTINHHPLSPMIQPVINPYNSLPIKTVTSQLAYEDGIAKVKVGDIHPSPLIHKSSHFIIEDSQSVKHHLSLVHPCLLFPITFLSMLPETTFARSDLSFEDRWNICLF